MSEEVRSSQLCIRCLPTDYMVPACAFTRVDRVREEDKPLSRPSWPDKAIKFDDR